MKKLVLKVDVPEPDDGAKRKALKTVSGLPGIDAISIDMKERKMTIIGTVDPTKVVSKLRKYWTTELLTVGPAKEPEKEEPKKDEAKKEEGGGGDNKKPAEEAKKDGEEKKPEEAKKEAAEGETKKEGEAAAKGNGEAAAAAGGEGEGKKEEEKKQVQQQVDPVLELVKAYRAYNPHMTKYYYVQSMEENPNACVIC